MFAEWIPKWAVEQGSGRKRWTHTPHLRIIVLAATLAPEAAPLFTLWSLLYLGHSQRRAKAFRLKALQWIKNESHLVPKKNSADGVLAGAPSPCPLIHTAGQSHLFPTPRSYPEARPSQEHCLPGPLPSD